MVNRDQQKSYEQFRMVLDRYQIIEHKKTFDKRKMRLWIAIVIVILMALIFVIFGDANSVEAVQEFRSTPISTPQVALLNRDISLQAVKVERSVPTAPNSDCSYWDNIIDSTAGVENERVWLKRIMRCESSCRSDVVNKYGYTGLFQWSPYYWGKQFPDDDIMNGHAQIRNSLWKYRQGGAGIWECK